MTSGEHHEIMWDYDAGLPRIRSELSSVLLAYRALCEEMDAPIENPAALVRHEINLRSLANRMHKVTWDYCQYLEHKLNRDMSAENYTKRLRTVDNKWQPILNHMNDRISACERVRGFSIKSGYESSSTQYISNSFAGCALG